MEEFSPLVAYLMLFFRFHLFLSLIHAHATFSGKGSQCVGEPGYSENNSLQLVHVARMQALLWQR
jgi:hypothetical protein